jgi:hypothetical protein
MHSDGTEAIERHFSSFRVGCFPLLRSRVYDTNLFTFPPDDYVARCTIKEKDDEYGLHGLMVYYL